MTGRVYVDTGAWYAVQVPDDKWHSEAANAMRKLVTRGVALVTTNLVVGETYTLLSRTHGHTVAFRFVDQVQQSQRLELVYVEGEMEQEAYSLLRRFSDQAFSYVDGTSFVVMRRRRIRTAFAFDQHFAVAGFVRIPIDQPP